MKYFKLSIIGLAAMFALGIYGCDKGDTIGGCSTSEDCPHPTLYRCDTERNSCLELNPPHCRNGKTDKDETDQDCGGSCTACDINRACKIDLDCKSNKCEQGICISVSCTKDSDCDGVGHSCDTTFGKCSTCLDNKKNGDETDVDCGGPCSSKCSVYEGCKENKDCQSDICGPTGACEPMLCQKNEDCNVANAEKCDEGVCISCHDGEMNGDETDIDCGGSCNQCSEGNSCKEDKDCDGELKCSEAKKCTDGTTAPEIDPEVVCSDGQKNNDETAIDCGGSICPQCSAEKECKVDSDCQSWSCKEGLCASAACVSAKSGEIRINEVFTNPDASKDMTHSTSKQMKYIELFNSTDNKLYLQDLQIEVEDASEKKSVVSLSGCIDAKTYLLIHPASQTPAALDEDAKLLSSSEIETAISSTGKYKIKLVNRSSASPIHGVSVPDMTNNSGVSAAWKTSPQSDNGLDVLVPHTEIKPADAPAAPHTPGLYNEAGEPQG